MFKYTEKDEKLEEFDKKMKDLKYAVHQYFKNKQLDDTTNFIEISVNIETRVDETNLSSELSVEENSLHKRIRIA